MKAFSYFTPKNEPRVGLEFEGKPYNFTYIWQIFKDIENSARAPDLFFIQLMVELEYFSARTFLQVIDKVKEFRPLQDLVIFDDFRIDLPVSRPQKILCIGRNYASHAKETNAKVPDKPMFFSKLTSALLAHNGHIRLAEGIGRVDHEIELAVVMGKTASRVSVEKAMEHVAGYTIANDITAREMQAVAKKKGIPWTLSKGLDTFCPMGPYLVPADSVKDPHNLDMELTVNGKVRQKANTGEMVFKIPELISYISTFITLQPGDILCTGTPEGILPIEPGDEIEATIEGLGTLKNRVVQA
jgi:2-keto-4-pentenoate hydratase/2-oxohepta-3-ene-1,7-dioic acid hydratase in catechol pathway